MKALLTQILSDDAGTPSSVRLLMVMAAFVVLFVWAVESFRLNQVLPIPDSVVVFVTIAVGAKVAQRKISEPVAVISPDDKPNQ